MPSSTTTIKTTWYLSPNICNICSVIHSITEDVRRTLCSIISWNETIHTHLLQTHQLIHSTHHYSNSTYHMHTELQRHCSVYRNSRTRHQLEAGYVREATTSQTTWQGTRYRIHSIDRWDGDSKRFDGIDGMVLVAGCGVIQSRSEFMNRLKLPRTPPLWSSTSSSPLLSISPLQRSLQPRLRASSSSKVIEHYITISIDTSYSLNHGINHHLLELIKRQHRLDHEESVIPSFIHAEITMPSVRPLSGDVCRNECIDLVRGKAGAKFYVNPV